MLWFILFLLVAALFVLFLVLFIITAVANHANKSKIIDLESAVDTWKRYQGDSQANLRDAEKRVNESNATWQYLSKIAPNLFGLLRYKHKDYYGNSEWHWDAQKIKRLATDAKTRADDDATLALIHESGL